MTDDPQTIDESKGLKGPSNRRIIILLVVLPIAGAAAAAVWSSPRAGAAILLGGGLSLINYFWLRRSLRQIFSVAEKGERPRIPGISYFLRYVILGLIIAAVYASGLLPVVPLILGMAAFGFVVIVEALLRVLSGIFSAKES